jgi:ubiquinone/menaquinone biosynthesis C-methylase UbiE
MPSASTRVRSYYRKFDEWGRLASDPYHELEFETTLQYLRTYLPRKGLLLDAGGGPGRYTIALARRGYDAVLLDLTPELLVQARTRIRQARVASHVRAIVEGSVVDLSRFPSQSFDAVLCLGGPLGHLVRARDRERALRELFRVAKKGAPVFVSVIGRIAVLVRGVGLPQQGGWARARNTYRRILRTGDYDGRGGFAPSHFYLPEELRANLESAGLRVVEMVGLQGLASTHRREVNELAQNRPAEFRAWRRFHLETCTHPQLVAMSEQILAVARRPLR